MNMNKLLPALVFIFAAACAPKSPPDMTLDRLLDANAQARGGKELLDHLQSVEVTVDITEPSFTVTGHYRASRDGLMRIDVYAGEQRVFTEALGPDGGWQMFGDGTIADLSEDGDAALRRGVIANLYGLHELPALGYTLNFLGASERNGTQYWELEKTAPDGFSEHLYFDQDTYLVASRLETSALHPDIDSTQLRKETFETDYSAVDGVMFSGKSETRNMDSNELLQTTIVTSRQLNIALEPAQFERPQAE